MKGWDSGGYTSTAAGKMYARTVGELGELPQVVCVHGLGASSRYFTPVARALARYTRVTAVDLPGFGRTPGPTEALNVRELSEALAAWLRATGRTGGPVLMGNSMGCQVLVDLAQHSPELLGPLVLIGPTMDAAARSAVRQGWRLARNLPYERPSILPLLARDYARCGVRRYLGTLRYGLQDAPETKLAAVTTTTLVVRGAHDPIVPRRWARQLVDELPDGRLVEIGGAGHAVNYSTPEPLARVVRELLLRS